MRLRLTKFALLTLFPFIMGLGTIFADFDSPVGTDLSSPLPAIFSDHVDFGSTVALSADAHRMLVGAPGFDYAFDIRDVKGGGQVPPSVASPNQGGGAVFLYELRSSGSGSGNQAAWDLKWALFGTHNEGLGRYVSMSADGRTLAIRRGVAKSRDVEVYFYSSELGQGDAEPVGGLPAVMGQTCAGGSIEVTDDYLVTSCEIEDKGRGRVHIYELKHQSGYILEWEHILTLSGDNPGDRFGQKTSLDPTRRSHSLFRLAVSAPNFSNNKGMVRVYDYNSNTRTAELVGEFFGNQEGEHFGFDIAFSQTTNPYLAVGAPRSNGEGIDRGSLRIWAAHSAGSDTPDWTEIASFSGVANGDRMGRSVAMTPDASRVAASNARHDGFTGLIQVFERTGDSTFESLSMVKGDAASGRWGNDIALSRSGSILVSGSIRKKNGNGDSVGSVRVIIDRSPFCSAPLSGSEDAFEERRICRKGHDLVKNAASCNGLVTTLGSCFWKDKATLFSNEGAPTLSGCPCDEAGNCLTGTEDEGSALYLCIAGSRSEMESLGVTNFHLGSENSRVVILHENSSRFSGVTALCQGETCVMRTPIGRDFFNQGHADHAYSSGIVVMSFGDRKSSSSTANKNNNNGRLLVERELDNEELKIVLPLRFWISLLALALIVVGCSLVSLWKRTRRTASSVSGQKARGGELTKSPDYDDTDKAGENF